MLQSIVGVSLTSKKYEIEVENEGSLFVSREYVRMRYVFILEMFIFSNEDL